MTVQGEPYNEGYLQICDRPLRGDRQAVLRAVQPRERGVVRTRPECFATAASPCSRAPTAGCGRCGICCATRPGAPVRPRRRRHPSTTRSGSGGGRGSPTGTPMSELDGLALLADYGLPVVAARPVVTAADAVAAADAIGYPVVVKTAAPGHHAQVRCRRCPRRAARRRRGPRRVRGHRRAARSRGRRRRDGARGGRGRARCRRRSDVRPAGAGRGGRRARGGAARPTPRARSARRRTRRGA